MQCNAFVERRPFRNLSPYIPQFAITSTTKDISSHETTLRKNAKLPLSNGSDFLLHDSPHLIGKLRRARVCLTAPGKEVKIEEVTLSLLRKRPGNPEPVEAVTSRGIVPEADRGTEIPRIVEYGTAS